MIPVVSVGAVHETDNCELDPVVAFPVRAAATVRGDKMPCATFEGS